MPEVTRDQYLAARGPSYRCQGCGKYLSDSETAGFDHCRVIANSGGEPEPWQCGPVDSLLIEQRDTLRLVVDELIAALRDAIGIIEDGELYLSRNGQRSYACDICDEDIAGGRALLAKYKPKEASNG